MIPSRTRERERSSCSFRETSEVFECSAVPEVTNRTACHASIQRRKGVIGGVRRMRPITQGRLPSDGGKEVVSERTMGVEEDVAFSKPGGERMALCSLEKGAPERSKQSERKLARPQIVGEQQGRAAEEQAGRRPTRRKNTAPRRRGSAAAPPQKKRPTARDKKGPPRMRRGVGRCQGRKDERRWCWPRRRPETIGMTRQQSQREPFDAGSRKGRKKNPTLRSEGKKSSRSVRHDRKGKTLPLDFQKGSASSRLSEKSKSRGRGGTPQAAPGTKG